MSVSSRAVSMMIGVVTPSSRASLQMVAPSTTGIMRSSRMQSYSSRYSFMRVRAFSASWR